MMVRLAPEHLLNQEITVISGGMGYDSYGETTYSEVVVATGSGRLEYFDERTVDAGGEIVRGRTRVWVNPTLDVVSGQVVVVAGTKYKTNFVEKLVDGRGYLRLKVLQVDEVAN